VPTLWGALALASVLGGGVVAVAWNANAILALQAPALGPDGHGARVLVVEGWMDAGELEQAAAAIRRGRYERVVTTGGPIEPWYDAGAWRSNATRAAEYLRSRGVPPAELVALPAPSVATDRTYENALMVRDWAARSRGPLDALDVYTRGVHARRSRMLYQLAMGPRVEVGVLAADPSAFDAAHWWRSSEAAKNLLGESIAVLWTKCCFWPAP